MARAKANVPQFGNWDNGDQVPYTVYFDKARKNKGGKLINPNDPQENPELFGQMQPSQFAPPAPPRTKPVEPMGRGTLKPTPENEFKQFRNSPARSENRSGNESSYGGRGQRPARSSKGSIGSEQGFERSPLHKAVGAKESGPPSWESKSHDNHGPAGGKSRFRTNNQGDESPDKAAAVPRFGAWDESDPESAENFTHIFNKVREERTNGPPNTSATPNRHSYTPQKPIKRKSCCFPW